MMRVMTFVALLIYIATVAFISVRAPGSTDLILVAVEQIFLTGALVSYLWWEGRNSNSPAGTPVRLPVWLPFACYLVLITVVIAFATRHAIGVDESAMLFQAKTFRTGNLSVPAPPESEGLYRAEFHFIQHVIYRGRWLSEYQPGWPAIIALAMTLGVQTLLNPALALLYLILVYKLAREVLGVDTAVLATLVLATAPAFLYLASGFLTHIPCGLFVLGAFYCAWRARQPDSPVRFLAGVVVCLACAATIRQYTALLAGLIIGPLAISGAWPSRKRMLVLAGSVMICGAALAGWNFYYNQTLMGDPMRVPYSLNFPQPFIWSPAHLFNRLVNDTRWSLQGTMMYGFVLMFPFMLVCLFRERAQRLFVWSLAAIFAALVLGHIPFSLDSGQYFWRPESSTVSFTIGQRFYSEAYFAVAILTGRGLELVFEYFHASRRAATVCLIVLVLAQCVHIGVYMEKTRERNNYAVALQRFVLADPSTQAVIFGPEYFGDINFNDPDWQHEPKFYMRDPGESRREALVRLLGRRNWVVVRFDDGRRVVTAQQYSLPNS
jgi:hypothetical protein